MLLVFVAGLAVSLIALLEGLVVSLLALLVSQLPFFASFNIFSFRLFMYFSLPLRLDSTRCGFFITSCDFIFILRSHLVFDSAKEKVKCAM